MRLPLLIGFILLISGCAQITYSGNDDKIDTLVTTGFECASELLPDIKLLGLGSDYVQFISNDINQYFLNLNDSKVSEIKCLKHPKVYRFFMNTDFDNPDKKEVVMYRVTFPLQISLKIKDQSSLVSVRLSYRVKNLHDMNNFELERDISVESTPTI